ncbi:hypothetical protein DSO57_1026314 [Entomophthora muscae]|uniref:Uncharacterized protein n=1 Tax=Entomophthora muscae TaxID=34485 RepID=A0ACC2SR20_9FUNG|nr:hypothetical protein DSO57_1026314 [Entomophthora muscae]
MCTCTHILRQGFPTHSWQESTITGECLAQIQTQPGIVRRRLKNLIALLFTLAIATPIKGGAGHQREQMPSLNMQLILWALIGFGTALGQIQEAVAEPLKGDKAAQAATMFFLVLALVDYVIYFAIFVYVFLFVVFESKTIPKFLFSSVVVLTFTAIRMVFLPLILNAIPYTWAPKFPTWLMEFSFYACTISYIVFFNAPVLACLYFVIKFGFGGEKLKAGIKNKDGEEPMVVIMMPIYNEEPVPLFRAVESAIRSDYPSHKLHVLLAFDDEKESPLYWSLLKRLKILNKNVHQQWRNEIESAGDDGGMFLFPPRLELMVEGVRLTICRFPHEGKSATQGKGFQIVNEIYGQNEAILDNTYLMFIDSDVILHDNAVYNFASTLVSKPRMNAVTGYITCRTSESPNLLHYLQDSEYLEGQMFARSLEALSGSVTCLPGALTLLRLRAMQAVAPKYFIEFDKRKPLHFHRFYLGEDRYMTHLLMEESDRGHTIGLCGASRCKTDAPDNWRTLIKQRRRWYLGALINEAHMLCTPKLWRTMPLLLSLKLFDYASGSLSWLFMVYVVGVIKGVVPTWTIAVFFPCLVLKYFILSINASFMNRTKIFITFPIFFFISPIFKMWCTIYSIFTWDTRSWGGPRTDVAEKKVSSVEVMDELMRQRLFSMKRSKKMVRQMRQRTKIVHSNMLKEKESDPSLAEEGHTLMSAGPTPVKRLLPFPYEVEVLGGGEYFEELIYPEMIPAILSPRHTVIDMVSYNSDLSLADSFNSAISTPTAVDDAKYVYGKYQRSNPSASSVALDVASLSRLDRLARTQREMISTPSSVSYRLQSARPANLPHLPSMPFVSASFDHSTTASLESGSSASLSCSDTPPPAAHLSRKV